MALSINLDNLTTEEKTELATMATNFIEQKIGFTLDRAVGFLDLSCTENPQEDTDWHIQDAKGKFKHFLRKDDHLEGAVDALWSFFEPYANDLVDAAVKATQFTWTPVDNEKEND